MDEASLGGLSTPPAGQQNGRAEKRRGSKKAGQQNSGAALGKQRLARPFPIAKWRELIPGTKTVAAMGVCKCRVCPRYVSFCKNGAERPREMRSMSGLSVHDSNYISLTQLRKFEGLRVLYPPLRKMRQM